MPNFDDNIFKQISELEVIIRKDVKTIHPSLPVMKALEEMAQSYRSLPVVTSDGSFRGLFTVMRAINYLGGGELFRIVEKRHGYNIYSALNKETVESIMETNPVVLSIKENISEALSKMIIYGAGVLPVLDEENRVRGIVTEHDFVKYLSGSISVGLKARDIMSKPVVTIIEDQSLKDAMETMVKHGFRRLPVVDRQDAISGILTAVDIVRRFGYHDLFKYTETGDIREILGVPVSAIMVRDVAVVHPDDDVSTVVSTMLSRDISSVLVVNDEGSLEGIITERDVLYAIIAPK